MYSNSLMNMDIVFKKENLSSILVLITEIGKHPVGIDIADLHNYLLMR